VLVMRSLDFRANLMKTFLSQELRSLLQKTKKPKQENTIGNLKKWLESATAMVQEEDPLVWGFFVWQHQNSSKAQGWELALKSGRAGLSMEKRPDHTRLQWGEELLAEIIVPELQIEVQKGKINKSKLKEILSSSGEEEAS
jgi:hypothetical protein